MSGFALTFPPELVEAIAQRAAAIVLEREQPHPSDGGYLAPAAAAEYLGVKVRRVYDLKSMGALEPDGYDGRTPLWTRATLDAYVRRAG